MPIRIPGRRALHSPGPTHVPDEVVAAMARQPTDLADPRVAALVAACESGLQDLLQTARAEVFFYSANGHGGWEAVISNLVAPGTSILVPRHRPFLGRLGRAGRGVRRDRAAHAIRRRACRSIRRPSRRRCATTPDTGSPRSSRCHTDTASGTTSDLAAIRRAIDAAGHPALFAVDVVASLGAAPFAMDALGVNVAMGASQKGLMLQPGMAFVAVDERAMDVARANPAHRFYWDWLRRRSEPVVSQVLRHAAALPPGRPRSRARADRRGGTGPCARAPSRASRAPCTLPSAAGPSTVPSACSRRRHRPARSR
jgi:alanine-glyoxylate transaminase/serine-glyoxylate transaminase/serine-pyruvate transaminase